MVGTRVVVVAVVLVLALCAGCGIVTEPTAGEVMSELQTMEAERGVAFSELSAADQAAWIDEAVDRVYARREADGALVTKAFRGIPYIGEAIASLGALWIGYMTRNERSRVALKAAARSAVRLEGGGMARALHVAMGGGHSEILKPPPPAEKAAA